VWRREARDHADRRLPVFLRVHSLSQAAAAEGRRLLRVLLLRIEPLSADPSERQDRFLLPLKRAGILGGVPLISVPKVPVLYPRKRGKKCLAHQ
jgi:hypothetical protein